MLAEMPGRKACDAEGNFIAEGYYAMSCTI